MKKYITLGVCSILFSYSASIVAEETQKVVKFNLPKESSIPNNELGRQIRLGKRLVNHTNTLLPNNVGNKLHCTSCHLESGTVPHGLPWVDVTANYPRYRSRNDKVVDIQGRINGCFQRSMNGKPLDVKSKEMAAIVSYMEWLAQGLEKGKRIPGSALVPIDKNLVPDAKNGQKLYVQHCMACHREEGKGLYPNGKYLYPALSGNNSFNDGAGMARTYKAAAFIKHNMPLYMGETLTEQEAVDVAEYITKLSRPVFPDKHKDWPKGGRPKDAR